MPSKNLLPSLLFGLLFILFTPLHAHGATSNVTGFAWSEIVGWISFSNASGGGSVEYGVSVDSTSGVLSGYAWSENIGWISFNRTDTGAPPTAPFNGSETFVAQMNTTTGRLSGWARALAEGDGWIKWSGTTTDNQSSYGVTINLTSGRFSGWAWGGEAIGWITFECGAPATCGTVTYAVPSSAIIPPPPGSVVLPPPVPPPVIPKMVPPVVPPSGEPSPVPPPPPIIKDFANEASIAATGSIGQLLDMNQIKRDISAEVMAIRTVNAIIGSSKPTKNTQYAMINFVTYGTPRAMRVSSRTRGWVLGSFKDAFGTLPTNEKDWEDVIRIANATPPDQRSKSAEDKYIKTFETVYKRKPDRTKKSDDMAILLLTYGIRPVREPNREARALKIFNAIYKKDPQNDKDWNIIRMIGHSGAKR